MAQTLTCTQIVYMFLEPTALNSKVQNIEADRDENLDSREPLIAGNS